MYDSMSVAQGGHNIVMFGTCHDRDMDCRVRSFFRGSAIQHSSLTYTFNHVQRKGSRETPNIRHLHARSFRPSLLSF